MIKHVYISCSLYQKKLQHEMAKIMQLRLLFQNVIITLIKYFPSFLILSIMSWFFVYIFALVWLNNLETLIYKYKEFRGSTKIACLISKSWKTHNPRIFPNA